MIPKDADVPGFAKLLASQAKENFPPEIPKNVQEFIGQVIFDFIQLAGNALNDDKDYDYTMDQTRIVCQLVGEWMFHKGIDIYKGDIPDKFWKPILQQIAFAVYETGRRDVLTDVEAIDTIVTNAENAVKSTYENLIGQLEANNQLTKSKEEILKQSNLNDYVEQTNNQKSEEEIQKEDMQEIKYMTLALYLKGFFPDKKEKAGKLLKRLDDEERRHILTYMNMPDLEQRVDPVLYNQYLEKFHNSLPKIQNKKSRQFVVNKVSKAFEGIEEEDILTKFSLERTNVKNFILQAYNGRMLDKDEDIFSKDLTNVIVDYVTQCDF